MKLLRSIATALCLTTPSLAQTIWYVDASAPAGGDGSPGAPYNSIQVAVDATTTLSGDVLHVLPGTYVELVTIIGKALTIDCAGAVSLNRPPGSSGPLIDLINIPTGITLIDDLRMYETSAPDTHAAVRASNCAKVAARNCLFRNHQYVIQNVGNLGTTLVLGACTIDNCALKYSPPPGGLIELKSGDVLIATDLVVQHSTGPIIGTYSSAVVECSDSLFLGNFIDDVYGVGGSVVCSIPQAHFVRCTFRYNESWSLFDSYGGAVRNAEAVDCLFESNYAYGDTSAYGGAMYGGSALNCTFYRNLCDNDGPVYWYSALAGPLSDVRNCIFYDDAFGVAAVFSLANDGALPPGNGNILGVEPSFVDLTSNPRDFRLWVDSPCIDAGDPAYFDSDGSRRDMGYRAFEPVGYCVALPTSAGELPLIGATGSARLTGPDDYLVSGDALISSNAAILLRGVDEADLPFFGRTLCVQTPIVRTAVVIPGADGHVEHLMTQANMVAQGLGAGDDIFWQWWFRDPGDSQGVGLTCGLADAIRP